MKMTRRPAAAIVDRMFRPIVGTVFAVLDALLFIAYLAILGLISIIGFVMNLAPFGRKRRYAGSPNE